MVRDRFYDLLDDGAGLSIDAWRCVNCGEVLDRTIIINRLRSVQTERLVRIFGILAVAFGCSLAACGGIPSGVLKQVDQGLTFEDAKTAPEIHRGKIFLLGGTVDERMDFPDTTKMRIRQHPVDTRYRPHALASSEGEFLVVIRPPVNPVQYPKGKRVTMVGKLTGVEPVMGGVQTEPLPSFEALFLRSWEPPLRRDDLSYDQNYLESSPGSPGGIGYGPYPYSYP